MPWAEWAPYCQPTMGDAPNDDLPGARELRAALASPDPSIRARAVLRAPPGPGVEPMMLAALDDEDPEVRLASVQALIRLGGPAATRAVMAAAARDPSPAVRAEALAGLARILQARRSGARRPD